ncbi:MAG TPA: alpha/beta fold hydrolase [Nitriliruptorales bacterium]|nr:alpha/beta fold hydrolase [Nitriliruptorales bacterium]
MARPLETPMDGAPQVEDFLFGGHRLVYERRGSGPRVTVLVHGVLLDAHLHRGLATSLASQDDHRVILLELLGHGRSDRPTHATLHRVDTYARQLIALLDHLGIDQAVIGGTSLGANVALEATVIAPHRVRGLVVETPVLEWAAPAAGLVFIPMLLAARFGGPLARGFARTAQRLPRTGYGLVDTFLNAASMAPREVAAVLHGVLIGPLAPPVEARRAMDVPALVLGHGRGAIHPFSDAENLANQLPRARLVQAKSALELRTRPTRLTGEIRDFLDEVWQPRVAGEVPARA